MNKVYPCKTCKLAFVNDTYLDKKGICGMCRMNKREEKELKKLRKSDKNKKTDWI